MTRWIAVVTLLASCTEYKLGGREDPDPEPEDSDVTPTDSDTATVPDEECNGADDDGDGEVDEGFGDADADGTADCEDDDCDVDLPAPRAEIDESCALVDVTPPADPWEETILWSYEPGHMQATPTVGDLDGDGTPEVVVVYYPAEMAVLDGASGTVEWSATGVDPFSGTALADVDVDGDGDVIVTSGGCDDPHTVIAYDGPTGALLWTSAIGVACETYPAVADLDSDGDVEIVVNEYVLDGSSGAIVATLPISGTDNWGAPAIADMDVDGDQEILLENRMYAHDGTWLMTCGTGGVGTFPQPVNVDGDVAGEMLVAGWQRMTLCDDDGSTLWTRTYAMFGTAVAVADFDDDGVQDFAFAQTNALTLISGYTGADVWSTTVADYSGLSGATSWDVDLDGVPEVVYGDEHDLLVLDGATGWVKIRQTAHGSGTLAETPAVADVDGNGTGELLSVSNIDLLGLTVTAGAGGDWPWSRPTYNQYTYFGANIEDDLSVPLYQEPPWLAAPNLFRGQPSALFSAGDPNLTAAITGVCAASCEAGGAVEIAYQVANTGYVRADATIVIYGNPGGVQTAIAEVPLGFVASGASVEGSVLATAELLGTELTIVVDEAGAVGECHEDDNRGTFDDLPCGP
jgi:hypothetical protein